MKKALFLDRTQLSLVRDVLYAEWDAVTSNETFYTNNAETAEDLQEILDQVNEIMEDD
jgi:hypothetical protein